LLFVCALTLSVSIDPEKTQNTEHTAVWKVAMPAEDVLKPDTYRCVALKLPADVASIRKVQAFPSDRNGVHHAMVYVCQGLADTAKIGASFPCFGGVNEFCTGRVKQVFGYDNMQTTEASAVAPFVLPDGVGIVVGQKTDFRYAVLQVHNNKPIKREDTYFTLTVAPTIVEPNRMAITQLVPPDFTIPPRHKRYTVHVPAVTYQSAPFHLWGTHVHFHSIGTLANFSVARRGKTVLHFEYVKGASVSSTIKYPKPFKIESGDVFSGSCTYDSSGRAEPTVAGMTHDTEEMCNLGLMCFVKCGSEAECDALGSRLPGAVHGRLKPPALSASFLNSLAEPSSLHILDQQP